MRPVCEGNVYGKRSLLRFISCKDGLDKDRNGMDLTEAEDIKKRCQEYTEELY